MNKHQSAAQALVTAALLLAVGLILPFFTGQIPQIGNMLCPMHLPVLLCGLLCGWKYGLADPAAPPVRPLLRAAPVPHRPGHGL